MLFYLSKATNKQIHRSIDARNVQVNEMENPTLFEFEPTQVTLNWVLLHLVSTAGRRQMYDTSEIIGMCT